VRKWRHDGKVRYVIQSCLSPGFCNCLCSGSLCSAQSSNLACVLLQEYGSNPNRAFTSVLYIYNGPSAYRDGHPFHFINDFSTTLKPLTTDIGRQANLLPLASPSSGVLLVYDPALKTLVTRTDSLGPILGERAETVGRHHLFIGSSYQFF